MVQDILRASGDLRPVGMEGLTFRDLVHRIAGVAAGS
jgi:hypothetical protein